MKVFMKRLLRPSSNSKESIDVAMSDASPTKRRKLKGANIMKPKKGMLQSYSTPAAFPLTNSPSNMARERPPGRDIHLDCILPPSLQYPKPAASR